MLVEISEKERTALSLLLGLRQKFARDARKGEIYSAAELHKLFSEMVQKINSEELEFIHTLISARAPKGKEDEVWGKINEVVEKTRIKRYNWNNVFGNSLTKEILRLKKTGMDVEETYKSLSKDQRVLNFIDLHKREKKKILENLKISVHARYGENETAKRVMLEDEE